jgi:hypothetical protein
MERIIEGVKGGCMSQEERWKTLKFILKAMLYMETDPQITRLYKFILEYMERLEYD